MLSILKDKYFMALAMLLAITLFSLLMPQFVVLQPKVVGVVLLFLAFAKVQIVISQYMELHHAVLAVRIAFWAWTVVVCASCIGMYLRNI